MHHLLITSLFSFIRQQSELSGRGLLVHKVLWELDMFDGSSLLDVSGQLQDGAVQPRCFTYGHMEGDQVLVGVLAIVLLLLFLLPLVLFLLLFLILALVLILGMVPVLVTGLTYEQLCFGADIVVVV